MADGKTTTQFKLEDLHGLKIKEVRKTNPAEMEALGWDEEAMVLVFDDGSILLPTTGSQPAELMYFANDGTTNKLQHCE